MSEQQHFSDLFITSAVISGPIIDEVDIGPCVNMEYSNCVMKRDVEDIRFNADSNIEERKEPYSDDELDLIYRNSIVYIEEDEYYERTSRIQMQKEMELYWERCYEEELEYENFLKEEEDRNVKLESYIGRANRR